MQISNHDGYKFNKSSQQTSRQILTMWSTAERVKFLTQTVRMQLQPLCNNACRWKNGRVTEALCHKAARQLRKDCWMHYWTSQNQNQGCDAQGRDTNSMQCSSSSDKLVGGAANQRVLVIRRNDYQLLGNYNYTKRLRQEHAISTMSKRAAIRAHMPTS